MASSGFDDAIVRVRDAQSRMTTLRARYKASLHKKEVGPELRLSVAQIIENLRAALDYCAYEVYTRRVGDPAGKNIYFPILGPGADWGGVLGSKIPGLSQKDTVAILLRSWQVTASPSNQWLADLGELANGHKHRNLVPQMRKEVATMEVGVPGSKLRMAGPLTVEKGGKLILGGREIAGPLVIDPAKKDARYADFVDWTTTVQFVWEVNGHPVEVISFCEKAIAGVERIVRELPAAL